VRKPGGVNNARNDDMTAEGIGRANITAGKLIDNTVAEHTVVFQVIIIFWDIYLFQTVDEFLRLFDGLGQAFFAFAFRLRGFSFRY